MEIPGFVVDALARQHGQLLEGGEALSNLLDGDRRQERGCHGGVAKPTVLEKGQAVYRLDPNKVCRFRALELLKHNEARHAWAAARHALFALACSPTLTPTPVVGSSMLFLLQLWVYSSFMRTWQEVCDPLVPREELLRVHLQPTKGREGRGLNPALPMPFARRGVVLGVGLDDREECGQPREQGHQDDSGVPRLAA
jgi:hypothetical protein